MYTFLNKLDKLDLQVLFLRYKNYAGHTNFLLEYLFERHHQQQAEQIN